MLSLLKYLPAVLPIAIEIVKIVEKAFGSGGGAAKRAAAVSMVKTVVMGFEGLTQRDIVDENMLEEGLGQVIDGVVKVLNSTRKFNIDNL